MDLVPSGSPAQSLSSAEATFKPGRNRRRSTSPSVLEQRGRGDAVLQGFLVPIELIEKSLPLSTVVFTVVEEIQ